ncbi:MAG: hypothetical protein JJT76_04950 [Clostridiaceae bacterium]|nr:hypothetical protein [Clostridiaceae bacterium]
MSHYYRPADGPRYSIREIPMCCNNTNECQQKKNWYKSNDVLEIKIPLDYIIGILTVLGLYFLRNQNFNLGTLLSLLSTHNSNKSDLIKKTINVISSLAKEEKGDLEPTKKLINEARNQESNMNTSNENIDPSNIENIVKEVLAIVDNLDLKSIKN